MKKGQKFKRKKLEIERCTFNLPKGLMDRFDQVCNKEYILQRTFGINLAILEFVKSREEELEFVKSREEEL